MVLNRSFFSALVLFWILLLPTFLVIDPRPVWDDGNYFDRFAHDSFSAVVGPFIYGRTFWRPLGTLTMLSPMFFSQFLGGYFKAITFSKAVSICLFGLAGVPALLYISNSVGPESRKRAALLMTGGLLALSPVFAESIMWLSARFDLLICLFLTLLLWRQDLPRSHPLAEGFLLGVGLCLSKEIGFVWSCVLGVSFLFIPAAKSWGKGLLAAAVLISVLRQIVLTFWTVDSSQIAGGTMPALEFSFSAFFEGAGRQFLMIFLPFADMNPLHPEGWGGRRIQVFGVGVILLSAAIVCFVSIAITKRAAHMIPFVWLAAAMCLIDFYALFCSLSDNIMGSRVPIDSLVPTRYLAPSALILYLLIVRHFVISGKKILFITLCSTLLTSIPVATQAKIDWSTDKDLWSAAWARGGQTTLAATNLAAAFMAEGQNARAEQLAVDWVGKSGHNERMCLLWQLVEQNRETSASLKNIIAKRRAIHPSCSVTSNPEMKLK